MHAKDFTASVAEEKPQDWHSLSTNAVEERLSSSFLGLTEREAAERLLKYGRNELLEEAGETALQIFFRQFRSFLMRILLVATVFSLLIGETVDALAILVILLLNGILGTFQEWQAERAIRQMKKMLGLRTAVIREGKIKEIEVSGVVPGDLVVLEPGKKVPADIRLLDSSGLETDEATLTGESTPIEKDPLPVAENAPLPERTDMAYMGTVTVNGHAKGYAVATGMHTEFGKIAQLSRETQSERTPLMDRLDRLGSTIGKITLVLAAVALGLGLIQGLPLFGLFLLGISLAVAFIPEGLPAVITLTLALGVKELARKKCLIRHLPASETLGSVTVICTDKTGTLTKNEMTVIRIGLPSGSQYEVTGTGYDPEGVFIREGEEVDPGGDKHLSAILNAGIRCNNATLIQEGEEFRIIGSPTEGALLVAAQKARISTKDSREPAPVTEFSFNSSRKRMTVVYTLGEGYIAYAKGAPEIILSLSSRYRAGDRERPLSEEMQKQIRHQYEEYAASGLRVIAIASRHLDAQDTLSPEFVEQDLTFLGMTGILDPPRPEVENAIRTCYSAGIEVMMITGDSPLTARAIADRIGLHSKGVLTGPEIESLSVEELNRSLEETKILARVSAEHKLRIIEALTRSGHVIAMTGDGVNDAPALKRAHIGVAMGIKGTDVAKESSDMILLDDNFASIVAGIQQGRREYDNIKKFTGYLLSSNTGEVVAILAALVLKLPLILVPVQILWINLVTDGVTALSLGVEREEIDVMRQKPRSAEEPVLGKGLFSALAVTGFYIGLVALILFITRYDPQTDAARARTVAFTAVIILETINLFNFRSFRFPLLRIGPFSNRYLFAAMAATILLQIIAVYTPVFQVFLQTAPLAAGDWILIMLWGLPILLLGELYKYRQANRRPEVAE
jgi:Ca2+-transporting ATPase